MEDSIMTAVATASAQTQAALTVNDLVLNALSDNPAGMGPVFADLMAARVVDAIAQKKIEVAQNTFGTTPPEQEAAAGDEEAETPPENTDTPQAQEGSSNGEDAQANPQ